MGAAAGTNPVASLREVRLKDRLQQLQQRLLHQPVHHRRDAELPHAAAGLRNLHPANRLRPVAPPPSSNATSSCLLARHQSPSSPTLMPSTPALPRFAFTLR